MKRRVAAELCWRHFGVHRLIAKAYLPGKLSDYARRKRGGRRGGYKVDEERLLESLPTDFLPGPPGRILLIVGDTGQYDGLQRFRWWAKYFDCYSLTVRWERVEEERL